MKSTLLSRREKEVLELIANEYTSDEIASKLFISNHTAHSHRKNLLSKLSVKNAAGLVRRGFELGFLQVQSPASADGRLNLPTLNPVAHAGSHPPDHQTARVKAISTPYLRNTALR